jgi:hypothetical protein
MSLYVYHATSEENYTKILQDGVLKANMWGVFFANKRNYAENFIFLGRDIKPGTRFAVIKIRKDKLRKKFKNKFTLSDDHNEKFFPKDLRSYVCAEDVDLVELNATHQLFELS